MAITLIAVEVKEKSMKRLIQKVTNEHEAVLQAMMVGEWKDYFTTLQVLLADLVRKELAVFEQEGSEHFIPSCLIHKGKKYTFREKAWVEGDSVALYGIGSDHYLSDFKRETMEYLEEKNIKIKN